ncbi:MAG: hypothetical protein WD771_04545 [Gemmatimonadaceae bacterium]
MRAAAVCLALALLHLGGCEGGDAKAAREQQAARAAMEQAAATATRAAATPSTGLWTEEHLVERLVRAGVAPRRVAEAAPGPEWMQVPRLLFLAGGGEVHAWIYPDSVARRAVTDRLEPLTGAPRGEISPYAPPFLLVSQNNLAAIIVRGRVSNHDRIALALQAGLPVTTAPPAPN